MSATVSSTDAIVAAISAVAPDVDAQGWANALLQPMIDNEIIITANRVALFVGQITAECAWKIQEENLNYTHAARLCQVYPREFPTENDAAPYVGNPTALANRVYAGRLGNGDEASGDGWTFRGVGLIQLTGRTNFTQFGKAVGKSPEEAASWCLTQEGAAASACWFWKDRELNEMADGWRVSMATKTVNGSIIDATRRIGLCNKAHNAIEALPDDTSGTAGV